MTKRVADIMNRTVFALREDERASTALDYLVALRIGCAPVVSSDGRPLGVVGWRDLLPVREAAPVSACMSTPPKCIKANASIREAAVALDEHDLHHLVVVAADGEIRGFVSGLDVVRGLIGSPARHPDMFPQFHPGTGLAWTSEEKLTPQSAAGAPAGAGLIAVLDGGSSGRQRVLWSVAVSNMQERLLQVLARSSKLPAVLRSTPPEAELWFRVAAFAPSVRVSRGGSAATLRDLIRATGRGTFHVRPTERTDETEADEP